MIKPKDTINHTTRSKPTFKGRLRILFGATIITDSEIGITEEVDVLFSRAVTNIELEYILQARLWIIVTYSAVSLWFALKWTDIAFEYTSIMDWIKSKIRRP